MATPPMSRVVEHCRRLALLDGGAGLSDEQLLETYLARREEAAFKALVQRHGSMVYGVCRRILHDRHDAEDAFQATFLVLIRKGAAIGKRELLANWLYGVARRTALKARKTAAQRRARERQAAEIAQKQVAKDDAIQDLLSLLDQELSRLPDMYRAPIILCDLKGLTRKKAAKQLGLPEATLSMRLDRARGMLAKKMSRHGVTLTTAAVALAISQDLATASVPPSLVSATVKIGSLVAAGKAGAAAALSAKVAALTEGMVRTMLLAKLKSAVAAVMVLGVFSAGAGAVSLWAVADGRTDSQIRVEGNKKERAIIGPGAIDKQPDKEPVKATPKDQEPKPKVFDFEFSSAPWAAVLDWLKDCIGLPLATIYRPTGSFTFEPVKGPDGKKKLYTVPEAIDAINEALLPQKLMVIRRAATFTVWPADGPIPPELIPFIETADLPSRGKTEIVKIDYPLKTVIAKKLAPDLNKLKGPFGEVVVLDEPNRLILVDSVANLLRIIGIIDETQAGAKEKK